MEGEKKVAKLLKSSMDDNYFLLNSLHFKKTGGDIDHLVLGPNGIFVIETKNWNGNIACNGDAWQRHGKRISQSPSEQAKRNATIIRHLIEDSKNAPFSIWVEAIVVFTSNHAHLKVNDPTVSILRLYQLTRYLMSRRSRNYYSNQLLENINKELIDQIF